MFRGQGCARTPATLVGTLCAAVDAGERACIRFLGEDEHALGDDGVALRVGDGAAHDLLAARPLGNVGGRQEWGEQESRPQEARTVMVPV